MQLFGSTSAREINRILKRRGPVWDPSQHFNGVDLFGPETVLEKMVYTIVNSVAAGLVSSHRLWPGIATSPAAIGTAEIIARPETFSKRSTLPAHVALELAKPPGFDDLSLDEFRDLLERRVEAREAEIRAEMSAQGQEFRGAQEVVQDEPTVSAPPPAPKGELNPRIACSDRTWRKQLLLDLFAFYSMYREAFLEFCAGVRDVVFPFGTYEMRLLYGVNCAPAPG